MSERVLARKRREIGNLVTAIGLLAGAFVFFEILRFAFAVHALRLGYP